MIARTLIGSWLAWCALQLVFMVVASTIARPKVPCFTGFAIVIPGWVRDVLTPHELAGVMAHERGHRHHLHVWMNFLFACTFMTPSAAMRERQELQADEFAIRRGYGSALASARATLRTAIAEGKIR